VASEAARLRLAPGAPGADDRAFIAQRAKAELLWQPFTGRGAQSARWRRESARRLAREMLPLDQCPIRRRSSFC